MRPSTVIVTSSSGRKPAPHTMDPTVIGGTATIGCWHKTMRALPVCGTIGCGGRGPGQPIGFAVIGGHRFGASDGGTSGWFCVGPASGCGVVRASGAGVVATTDALGLDVPDLRLVPEVDVQATVSRPMSRTALSVACLVMVIGL
jgi:hypothetical protein